MNYLAISTLMLFLDWGQTRHIERSDFIETNPIINQIGADKYFVTVIALNAGIGFMLPKKYRNILWGSVAYAEATYVISNHSIGIKVKF